MRRRFCQENRGAGFGRGRLATGLLAGVLFWGQVLTLPVYGGEESESRGETVNTQAVSADASRVQPAEIRLETIRAAGGEVKLFVNGSFDGTRIPTATDFEVTLGNQALPVRLVNRFSGSGEGVSYVCLVDVSGSIGRERMEEMKLFLRHLTENLTDRDRVCVVTLGNDTYGGEFLTDREAVRERIDGIRVLNEDTNLYYGIVQSLKLLESSGAGRKALVVVSDGEDDQAVGITKEEAAREAEEARIPIFTAAMLGKNPGEGKIEQAKILGSFARRSPGGFHTAFGVEDLSLEAGASRVAEAIGSTLVLTADLGAYRPGSGQAYLLVQMRTEDGTVLKDGYQIAEGELKLPANQTAGEGQGGREPGAGVGGTDHSGGGEKSETEEGGAETGEGEKGGAKKDGAKERGEENRGDAAPSGEGGSEAIDGPGEGGKHFSWPLIAFAAAALLAAGLYAAARNRKRAEETSRETEEEDETDTAGAATGAAAGGTDGRADGEETEEANLAGTGENAVSFGNSATGKTGRGAGNSDAVGNGEGAGSLAAGEAGEEAGSLAAGEAGQGAGSLAAGETGGKTGKSAGGEAGSQAAAAGGRLPADPTGTSAGNSGPSATRVYLTKVGLAEGTTYELTVRERAVIGSSPARADYVIEHDPLLSQAQCELTYRDGKLFIAALDHSRPTLVNGVPITSPYELCCDDVITIGQADYRVHW